MSNPQSRISLESILAELHITRPISEGLRWHYDKIVTLASFCEKVALALLPLQDPEATARAFHEAYERLAPSFGYETRKASAKPWDQVPEQNKALMRAVVAEVVCAPISSLIYTDRS